MPLIGLASRIARAKARSSQVKDDCNIKMCNCQDCDWYCRTDASTCTFVAGADALAAWQEEQCPSVPCHAYKPGDGADSDAVAPEGDVEESEYPRDKPIC